MSSSSRPPLSIALAVFAISACVLALEVVLTRIFSAVLRYHMVFMVVSIAICGLGVGGMLVYLIPRLRSLPPSTTFAAFAASGLAFLIVLFKLILPNRPDWWWLIALLVLVPFTFAGMFLATAFRDYGAWAGRLYAWDLAGAAVAAIGIVGLLQWFGPIHSYLLICLFAVIVGFTLPGPRVVLGALAVVCLGILIIHARAQWLEIPPTPASNPDYVKPLYAELADPAVGSQIIYSEWDAFARTDVVKDPQAGDNVLLIYTNGHVPTNLIRFDRAKNRHLLDPTIADVPFAWRKPKSALCIGPGGGLDIILAKRAGASRIDGVEVNPAIPRILRRPRFKQFGGDPYSLPGVNVVVGDGRTYVMRSRRQYDLIFLALTKTATGSAGLALVEGYIYTVEAFEEYLRHLTPHGQLVLVTDGLTAAFRLFATGVAALTRQGIESSQAANHLALIQIPPHQMGSTPYEFALMVSKNPISDSEGERLLRLVASSGYGALFIPKRIESAPLTVLRERSASLEEFSRAVTVSLASDMPPEMAQSLTVLPVTDDSPFFHDMFTGISPPLRPLLLPLVAGTAIAVLAFSVLASMWRADTSVAVVPRLQNAGYFSCLGTAFMLVEIPLVQKLILILGHPTLALTVVLSSLLLGGGIGAGLSQRLAAASIRNGTLIACLTAAFIAALLSFYLAAGHEFVLGLPLIGRVIWASAISGFAGAFMGMPFPLGMRALNQSHPDDVPWMWGINGLTSVLGSTLAAIGAKMIGFQMVLFGGAAIYLLAGLLRPRMTNVQGEITR